MFGLTSLAQSPSSPPSASPQADRATKQALADLQRQFEELRQKWEATTKMCQAVTMPARDLILPVGRYQIVMRDGIRTDTFLLDTVEGRVWRPHTYTNVDGQPEAWLFEERFDTVQAKSEWEIKMFLEGLAKEPPAPK